MHTPKFKLIVEPTGIETLQDFLDTFKLSLEVHRRSRYTSTLPQFYATIPRVESMEDGMLASHAGNGDTPFEAIEDLAKQLAGKRVAINAWGADRKEVVLPGVWR